ncbi:hypothetical protein BaRGS_00016555 [Batillaria attramentaria]|uniref:Uncharacterized protein n=1 Tax=Batillaria attramentaria TaxID=370345 RepID=A0ABD0KZA8_9CAEN
MAGYHETYPIQPEHGTTDLGKPFCAFEGKKFATSSSGRDVHEGKMILAYAAERKIVAKVRKGVSEKVCAAEVERLNFVQNILREMFPELRVEIVPTFYVGVTSLSTLYKMTTSKGHRNVVKEGFVLIQERVRGQVQELWSLDEAYCGRGDATLSQLACGIHRLFNEDFAVSRMKDTYLTSVTLHSMDKRFGPKDQGVEGIKAFKRWAKLHEHVAGLSSDYTDSGDCGSSTACGHERLQPTAPPAEDEDEVNCDRVHLMNALCAEIQAYLDCDAHEESGSHHSHELDPDFIVGLQDELPPGLVDMLLRKLWGPPPSYSEG